MEKDILKEELSISNDVNNITSKIKSIISNDYKQNKDNYSKYKTIDNNLDFVFFNEIVVKYNDININILYHVLITNDEKTFNYYKVKYPSKSSTYGFNLILFITAYNGYINWKNNSMSLQHEVEHLYQSYKMKKPILSDDKMKEYTIIDTLTNSNNFYDKVIGFTYYYYFKVEKNAIINGLYREIMDANQFALFEDPLNIIKNSPYYNNINLIKSVINNNDKLPLIVLSLSKINKTLKSYLRVANRMIDEYTKAFGRLLYKSKKDIEIQKQNWMINYGEQELNEY